MRCCRLPPMTDPLVADSTHGSSARSRATCSTRRPTNGSAPVRAPDFAGDNEAAFGRRRLRPSVLVDVSAVRTETTLLGATVVGAGDRRAGRASRRRSTRTASWRWPRAPRGPAACSSSPSTRPTSIEDIAAAQPTLPLWFQLYNWDDRDALAGVIARAEAAGAGRSCRSSTRRSGSTTPRPKIGFRLPAGGEVRPLRELARADRLEHLGVPRLAAVGDLAADRAQGDHDPATTRPGPSTPGRAGSSCRTTAAASWPARSRRSTRCRTSWPAPAARRSTSMAASGAAATS